MNLKRFKFKLHLIDVYKPYGSFALPLYFDYYPAGVKCKYGHWRVEFGERLEIYFLWWNITIRFNSKYWEDWCDKKNKESVNVK